MPDLGKYAVEVLTAYGASLVLLAGLVTYCVVRSRRAKAALARIEQDG